MRIAVVFLVACLSTATRAQILLSIYTSNPAAFKIEATGGLPGASVSSGTVSYLDGVTLLMFFTSTMPSRTYLDFGGGGTGITSSNLQTIEAANTMNGLFVENWSGPNVDLNFFGYSGGSNYVTFDTGLAGFTGSLVANIDNPTVLSRLPGLGASGDIRVGGGSVVGPIIGTWQVVPEPSQFALLAGLVLAGVVICWRRHERSGR